MGMTTSGFIRLWKTYYQLPDDEKVKILGAYMTLILGVSEQVVLDFLKGENVALGLVGKEQAAVGCKDTRPFWTVVAEIRPDDYSEEDIRSLCEPADVIAVFRMLGLMEPPIGATTEPGRMLNGLATIFK